MNERKARNQNIQVFVRLRPINAREKEIKSCSVVETCGNREIVIRQTPLESKHTKKFTFDRVFGPNSTQIEVYKNVVSPLIEEVLSGYSCTVFAYGQTGTGKTFTMAGSTPISSEVEGSSDTRSWQNDPFSGIIPRSVNQLFDELRLAQLEFTIRVSYLELYNEELFDLLAPTIDEQSTAKIRIFDDSTKKGSVIVQGLEEVLVKSKMEVYAIMAAGQEKRRTASTLMNAQSSRSHTVFSILVHIKEVNIQGEAMLKTGKLNLVDLAGSENVTKAGNDRKERARETVNINQSLLTLGRVISALVDRAPHIPYRESKLTRLLQDSLGGRTKTSIIATISPGHKDLDETMSTLDYAHRAKHIQNKPEINQKLTQKLAIKGYTDEIDRLRKELCSQREKSGVYIATEKYEDMVLRLHHQDQEISESLLKIRAYEEEISKKLVLYENLRGTLTKTRHQLNHTKNTLDVVQQKFKDTKKILKKSEIICDEKSHIIEAQANTEKLLSSQALDLISVAEVTTEEAEKLQNVLETRRKIDNIIKTSATLFKEKMNESIGEVTDSVDQYYEDCSNKSTQINQSLADLSNIDIQASDKIIESTNNTCSGVESLLVTMEEMQCSANAQLHKAFLQSFESSSEDIKECCEYLSGNSTKMLQKLTSEMSQTCNARAEIVKSLSDNLIEGMIKNKTLIQEYTDTNHIQIKNVKSMFEQFVFNTTSSIKNILDQKSNQNSCTELTKTLSDLTNFQNKFVTELDKTISNTQEMTRLNNEHFETSSRLELFKNAANSLNDQEIMRSLTAETEHIVNIIEKKLLAINQNNSVSQQKIVKLMDESTKNIAHEHTTIRNVLHKKSDDNVVSIKTQFNFVSQQLADLNLKNLELQNMLGNLHSLTKSYFNNINGDIVKYCSEELEVYNPTGQTPVRRTHTFSKFLASTSPHERILQRFRDERGYSSMLHESLDSSIVELDESSSSEDDVTMQPDIPIENEFLRPAETLIPLSKSCSETDILKPLVNQIESPRKFKMTKSVSSIELWDKDINCFVEKENMPTDKSRSTTKPDRNPSCIPIQKRDTLRVLNMQNK